MVDITDHLGARAVRIGSLWTSPESLVEVLGRYAKHIVCRNKSDEFPYTLRGTGAALRYEGNNYLFLCQHQTMDFVADEVGIITANRTLTGSNLIFPTRTAGNENQDFTDICALTYRAGDYGVANLGSEFFELDARDAWPNGTTGLMLVYGYPSEFQNVNYVDARNIEATKVGISGRYARKANAAWAHLVTVKNETGFDPDGMSGGPIFHIGRDDKGFFAGFAGIVTRGSTWSNLLQFIGGEFILEMLRKHTDAPQV